MDSQIEEQSKGAQNLDDLKNENYISEENDTQP